MGYSAVNHEKSLCNYFYTTPQKISAGILSARCFKEMLGGIPPNTQRLSCILIGCVFFILLSNLKAIQRGHIISYVQDKMTRLEQNLNSALSFKRKVLHRAIQRSTDLANN